MIVPVAVTAFAMPVEFATESVAPLDKVKLPKPVMAVTAGKLIEPLIVSVLPVEIDSVPAMWV